MLIFLRGRIQSDFLQWSHKVPVMDPKPETALLWDVLGSMMGTDFQESSRFYLDAPEQTPQPETLELELLYRGAGSDQVS